MTKNIYNIPSGLPFARALAGKLLADCKDKPENLSRMDIFLPTRRACRVLREAFLKESDGRPLILPRMQPLGDIDEEELSLSLAGHENLEKLLDLAPAIEPLQRQLLLARLIRAQPDFGQSFEQALGLAEALGHFMDQIYTENLDIRNIDTLVPAEFAGHWQITIDFLRIIAEFWPEVLKERGVMDRADRRNRLIKALAGYWEHAPPDRPVLAAGSTGSIPAVARLLAVIANLPQGQVILPGLDQEMDQESWDVLEESHPQFGLRQLLERMETGRHQVKTWPYYTDRPVSSARRILAREMMRPASTTSQWTGLAEQPQIKDNFAHGLEGLMVLECPYVREEAEVIATLMREALEMPGRTAVLVTPDRLLARRVQTACRRWDIAVDDSAGESLDQTPVGLFLRLALEASMENLAPIALLALLRHRLCRAGLNTAPFRSGVQALEMEALRGFKPLPGFSGLYARLQPSSAALPLVKKLESAFDIFPSYADGSHIFKDILENHIKVAEALAASPGMAGTETLWRHQDGEAAAGFLAALAEQAGLMPDMSLETYAEVFRGLMKKIIVRPEYGMHPRLMILGQLEARLIDADIVILGSLNESSWPPAPDYDPWMSLPMRRDFGLPAHERNVGLAAHDFIQGFCASRVIITRSLRVDGTVSVPARWLQRLDTVLKACNLEQGLVRNTGALSWAGDLDKYDGRALPAARPAPRPPVNKRPRKISATRVETWLKDPYSIYARYILNLKKRDPLEQSPDAAMRGRILHDILDRFVAACPGQMPEDAEEILIRLAQTEIEKHNVDPQVWDFWWPRFRKMTKEYILHERLWRRNALPLITESRGEMRLEASAGTFTISAVADRIDKTAQGLAIIDYKSGDTGLTRKRIENGDLPQLAIEALICAQGGFTEVRSLPVLSLHYWILTGGSEPVRIITADGNMETFLERTKDGLENLITAFDNPETPYYSLPQTEKILRFNDYLHLARVREWSAGEDGDAGERAA